MAEDTGSVAHGGHELFRRRHGFNHRHGVGVLSQIPQWTMTTRIEQGVIVDGDCSCILQAVGMSERRPRIYVAHESSRWRRLRAGFLTPGIDRRVPAFGRGERDLDTCV